MFHRVRRRCITLIEMMIVMFLIAMITGVIAYNYRGSMEEGKAFRTKAAIEKLQTILTLAASADSEFNIDRWEDVVRHSPIVQDADALIKDGWGERYQVSMSDDGEISVFSRKHKEYKEKKS